MIEVQTVAGAVPVTELGICLSHEHVLNDVTSWWHAPFDDSPAGQALVDAPVSLEILWELRQDPFVNRDNCSLDNIDVAVAEVARFAALGGSTIFEATSASIGRDPKGLREVSRRTGVNIVMGSGLYLDSSQPAGVDALTERQIADGILADIHEGVDGVRAGFIGEIGVGSEFTARERRSLAGASIAQRESGLPMQVHLPGWFRMAHDVLDVVEANGGSLDSVVLCHMNPSGDDLDYQVSLAARGAWIQYDMVGMEVFYADQQVQCPSDEDNARNIARLIAGGWGGRVLLSGDVFLKTLLRCNGGPGYGHILEYFLPRLERHGVERDQAMSLVTDNLLHLYEASSGR